ncbi:MAG: 50S ribosomal protein L10 [Candidatus Shikimatogenerans sp. JK-2022]|nr:50S ribosomal protein L10 [Candidatus Shikimatogenerans bostrichidophilus]
MNKKKIIIKNIKNNKKKYKFIYIIDISRFTSNILYNFKKDCYYNNIILKNVKNNLLKKVLDKKYHKILNGPTFLMFSNKINLPAQIIKKYGIYINNIYYPIFKGALIKNFIIYDLNKLLYIKSKSKTIINIIYLLKRLIIYNLINYKNYCNFIFLNILKGIKNE